jgi:NADH-quinone oxidoreductase subunit H
MSVADLPIGFLFVLAVSSLGVYGIALAGWSSNSKYSLLGGLRSSAQMISYEVAMGMSLIPLLLMTGNATFSEVIRAQQQGLWFILPLTLSFFIFMVAGFAETNRLPFDLPEAESELIAGYHTEYSAMKFSLFFIAEYANMVTVSAMMATLFFGGWDLPGRWDETGTGLATLLTGGAMFLKTFFFLFFFMWIRWTLPRFRYDQLMALGWKFLIPLALAYIMIITILIWLLESMFGITDPKIKALALFGVNAVLCYVVFFILDRGTLLSGSYRQPRAPASAGS